MLLVPTLKLSLFLTNIYYSVGIKKIGSQSRALKVIVVSYSMNSIRAYRYAYNDIDYVYFMHKLINM